MYYILKNDDNPKIVGSDYPQAWKFTKEYEKSVMMIMVYIHFIKESIKTKDLILFLI